MLIGGELVLYAERGTDLRAAHVATKEIPKLLDLILCQSDDVCCERPLWLTQADACERLNCGLKQLRDLTSSGVLAHARLGKGATYKVCDVKTVGRNLMHLTEVRALLGMRARSKVNGLLDAAGMEAVVSGFYRRNEALLVVGSIIETSRSRGLPDQHKIGNFR